MKKSILLLLFAFLFSSCEKENDSPISGGDDGKPPSNELKAPSGVYALQSGNDVTLRWTNEEKYFDYIKVYRSSGGSFSEIGFVINGTGNNYFVDKDLSYGVYTYKVKVYKDNESSEFSKNASVEISGPRCDISRVGTTWSSQKSGSYPAGTHYINDVELDLPSDCFLTGIGLDYHKDDIKTLRLKYRKLSDDCAIGAEMTMKGGASPNGSIEMEAFAPPQHAITGIELGVNNDDLRRLKIYYRKLEKQSDGTFKLSSEEKSYDQGNKAIELGLKISGVSNVDKRTTIITGVGLLGSNSGIYQIEFDLGSLD